MTDTAGYDMISCLQNALQAAVCAGRTIDGDGAAISPAHRRQAYELAQEIRSALGAVEQLVTAKVM